MPNIEKAKNHEGKTIFPVTVADAVLMGDGQTLKGKLSELGSEVSGLSGFTQYGYINPTTGAINNSDINKNLFVNTGYIKISTNGDIVLIGDTANKYNNALAFYDADKNYISGISNVTTDDTEKVTILLENIPTNARYIVASEKVESKGKAFLSYPSFVELKKDYIIDYPRGNNLYNKFYADVIDNNLVNDTIYKMRAVKRDRGQNVLTLSNNPSGWDIRILFYDVDNVLLGSYDMAEGTLDIPSTCDYIAFKAYGYTIRYNHDLMVNYGGEALPFEEFNSGIGYYVKINQLGKNIENVLSINSYNFGLNGYIDAKGLVTVGNVDAFRSTSLLHIAKDSEIWFKGDSSNQYSNVIAFYDANKNFISALSNIDEEEQVHKMSYSELPEGTRYIRVCRKKEDITAFVSYTPFEAEVFNHVIDIPKGNNLYNINNKYTELSISSLYFLPTAILRDTNQDKLIVSQRNSGYYLQVYFYDADYSLISRVIDLLAGSVTDIPNTCKYIVFRDYGSALQKDGTMVNYGEEILPYEKYNTILVKEEKVRTTNCYFSAKSDSLTSGSLSIDVPNVKYNQTIGLFAKVDSFGKITLSHGKRLYAAGMVDIDATNITTYTTVPQVAETYPHGLSINTFMEVLISQTDTTTAMLYIRTLGGEFIKEIPFNGSRDNVLCEVENCGLSDCFLTYTFSDYKKDVWAFGDSYFDYIHVRLKEIGYNNALFDAYSGRGSSAAIESLKKMIGMVGVPKIIYWAMGMNDADSDTAVNSSWNTALSELKSICVNYNVELVLATIPNVPSRSNRFKNEIVRNSGYRYVDNNKFVGADISDNWYSGLLGDDNVHPTTEGAKVLSRGLAISIPELKL